MQSGGSVVKEAPAIVAANAEVGAPRRLPPSLDRHALGEIAWFIHVAAELDGEVVGEQLERLSLSLAYLGFLHPSNRARLLGG